MVRPQQDRELSVGHVRDLGAQVVAEGRVDRRGIRPVNLKGGAQRRVFNVAPHVNRPGAASVSHAPREVSQ